MTSSASKPISERKLEAAHANTSDPMGELAKQIIVQTGNHKLLMATRQLNEHFEITVRRDLELDVIDTIRPTQ